jgi:glucose uptake protein GlcU
MQCALLVSGLWGIFFFKEIKGTLAITAFFASGAVLLVGAVVLGLYGPQRTS